MTVALLCMRDMMVLVWCCERMGALRLVKEAGVGLTLWQATVGLVLIGSEEPYISDSETWC